MTTIHRFLLRRSGLGGQVVEVTFAMAIHAITHFQVADLHVHPHLLHRAVAGGADVGRGDVVLFGEEFDVCLMLELHVIRQPVDANPVDGLAILVRLYKFLNFSGRLSAYTPDNLVADHALLYGRDTGRFVVSYIPMAKEAVDTELSGMDIVRELDRLLGPYLEGGEGQAPPVLEDGDHND